MDFRQQFIHWYYDEFQLDPLYLAMAGMAEESPHHRERNIGTHVDMVVSSYLGQVGPVWGMDELLGAFACAFHDVGKPASMEKAFKEERGWYKRFHGHELISARLWEDWVVHNWIRLDEFDLGPSCIHAVGWMIEKHLPWGIKDTTKKLNLALTCNGLFESTATFNSFLMADSTGRICDDDKIGKSVEWCREFTSLCAKAGVPPLRDVVADGPILYVPIGPTGCGKSTFAEGLMSRARDVDNIIDHYSWDDLRMGWYLSNEERLSIQSYVEAQLAYKTAFQRQIEDPTFKERSKAAFVSLLDRGNSVIVDNTNTKKDERRFFIAEARKRGYWIQAVLFPIELQTLIDRQVSRLDKTVPEEVVRRMYMQLNLPQYGEFDDVWTITDNLPVE